MNKNITMTISIGCVSLILTMLMFTQFKTVDETDIMAIETMRETELRSELANWKEKYDAIDKEIQERELRISEYKNELNNDANSTKLLSNEVKEAETYLGYYDVHGEGIVITLSDLDSPVDYQQLLELVNELKNAGAEAISINGQRIVSNSYISLVNSSIILIDDVKTASPYEIKAIGDKKYLESALTIKGGYIDREKVSIKIDYRVEDNIVIPKYDGEISLKYSKEYKEKEEEAN